MNTTLLLILLLPVIGGILLFTQIRGREGAIAGGLGFAAGALLCVLTFALNHGAAIMDTEVWNGRVIGKTRDHGTYEESYECRCRMVTKYRTVNGKRESYRDKECDTCYRTHYTVKWNCQTTIGNFLIDSRDSLSNAVYATPDPARYTSIAIGDPAARTNTYTNYVQAIPNSLFTQYGDNGFFDNLIPPYPDKIYDFYRNDHFLSPGFAFTDSRQWNDDLGRMLADLGAKKQVNAIVVIAKTQNQRYALALQDKWQGANKNDVVLVIGSTDGKSIDWVHVISWTKKEIFKVQLRDEIMNLKLIDRTQIVPVLAKNIAENYERRKMEEFEYLSDQIDPPTWSLWLLTILLIGGYGGFLWYWRKVHR